MQLTKKLFQLSKIMIIAGLGVFLLTVGNAQAAGMIYYTQAYNPYEVRSASLTTPTAITSLYTSATGSPYAVVLDSVNKKIYFSDPHSSVAKVYQCNMDGSNRVDFISNIHAQGLAVDTDHGYLYATDVRNGNVVRKNLSGGSESIIYNDSDAVFRAIAVDSGNSYIYLADYKSGKIIRADLNGGDAADFMTGIYATGLAVDSVNSKLYYAVSRKPDFYVGRASLATGGSKETIYTSDTGSPRGLCVDNAGGYIYIADWHSSKHAIYRASLTGAANPTVFISNANTFGIAISQICTVTFDSKGGSTVPSAEVLLNGKVNQPVNPTRAAFYFDGWFEDAAYTNAWDFLNDNVIDDMTLHARWKSSRPVVSTSAIDVSFTENGVPVAVDNGIIVTDGDSTVLSSAAVSIITGFQSGSDILSFVNNNAAAMGNITGNYSAGVLSLVSSSATATLAQWQNALRAVTYNNTSQDPGGSRTVRLTVNDGNYTSQNADKTISITAVNTAPTIITPAGISVGESTATPLTGISFADADSGAANVTAVFSVSAGAFSGVNAGAVSVSGNGTGSFTMTGTISDINNYINASELVYTPVSGSLDSITLSIGINDGGNAGSGGAKTASATAVISISAVNDLPQITAPATIPVTENTASSLSGISFSDADSGSGAVDVILSVSSGALTAVSGNGVTVAGSGTTIVTLSGTVANINTLILSGVLKFTTAFNNKNNITLGITIDDKGNSGSGGAKNASATVILQVAGTNHAPTIGITPPLIVTEDVSTPLAGIIFADDDAGNAAVEAVFSVTSGAFAATAGGGVAVDNVTTGSIKLTGSITDINTYIQGDNVGYTTAADNTSAITLSLLVNDKGNTGAG